MTHQQLPSYEEATARLDWLDLVAPYVRFADYRALCLVSSHLWRVFAPRLWRDPLWSVRQFGLDPGDDLAWWLNFVFNKLGQVRYNVRSLVQVLDARGFAKAAYHFASDEHEVTLQKSFEKALALFPNVDAVLLDGHSDIEPYPLLHHQLRMAAHKPLILSVADCPVNLPNTFFSAPELQNVVYLDLSGLRGSLTALTHSSPRTPMILPHLRVLKLRNREIDDSQLRSLSSYFQLRLWSLDLSDNRITDASLSSLALDCFPVDNLRSGVRAQVEGTAWSPPSMGSSQYGPFLYIEESTLSENYCHPERYFADTPEYSVHMHEEPQASQVLRSDGCQPTLHDSADASTAILCVQGNRFATERFRKAHGLTHLRLSRNSITSFGLMSLIRSSNGQLEHVACDSMPLFSLPNKVPLVWPRSAKFYGILGAAHVFRPVISSNLRVLRIHHSLVTHILTLEVGGFSKASCILLSENTILPRVKQAYPYPFVPDANPRLYSLTLTCIPRRSSGPLTSALINFLEQLSLQERAIQDTNLMAPSRRGPRLLQGLRHLRLEFESVEMSDGFSTTVDFDAEKLMRSGDQVFSFFEERVSQTPTAESSLGVRMMETSDADFQERLSGVSRDTDEFVTYHGKWNGETFSVPVWIGPTAPHPNSVINDYRKLVINHGLRLGAGPATPCQIATGAPRGSYVFHTTWCAAVMPKAKNFVPQPQAQQFAMKDVLQELKNYRAAGRAKYMALREQNRSQPTLLGPPHFYWTGQLEVSTDYTAPSW
ncbi:Leucine rich repeat domain containing protein [Paramyrothecium foliicola]|nr:Leucine rich repeat domain containing protein [Paramyrothecium foliicola]